MAYQTAFLYESFAAGVTLVWLLAGVNPVVIDNRSAVVKDTRAVLALVEPLLAGRALVGDVVLHHVSQ